MKFIKKGLIALFKIFITLLGLLLWIIVMLLPYCLANKIVEYMEERS